MMAMNETTELTEIKAAYVTALAEKDTASMLSCAGKLLSLAPTLGTAQQIIKTLPLELPKRAGVKLRVAFLRSYTVEPSIPLLKAFARLYGIELDVKVGEFNSYAQEIIDPSSWLYEFDPQVIFFAALTRDIAPSLWYGAVDIAEQDVDGAVANTASQLLSLVDRLRERCNATVILQNLEQPIVENAGLLDSRRGVGQAEYIRAVNRKLSLSAMSQDGLYVLDYDALTARHGRERWTDEKKWLTSRSPIAADCLVFVAQEYLRFIVPLAGRQSKVLAVDLDNTLWGGVIGEDGLNGIKIGPEYPGAAYLALQRAILDLYDRGVLLAICSKNNEADALEALENRPEMLLRPKHFAARRINWIDKAQNLKEIAAELNVGIDSISFIDDNPVERQRVKLELPEVTVIELPTDPTGYSAALRSSPVFERLSVTAEDRERGRYYSEQRERKQLESSAGSLEDFYRSLEMTAEFVDVTPETLSRIAQLTQKTNQLNMTTKRYTESEVLSLVDDPAWSLFGIRVLDKFGDNGIVGVVFLKAFGDELHIDTFLMSCRVIGRTVETAMLAHVDEIARKLGAKKLAGWFLPTKKNEPAVKIYSGHGFNAAKEDENGILWELDLTEKSIVRPEWIA